MKNNGKTDKNGRKDTEINKETPPEKAKEKEKGVLKHYRKPGIIDPGYQVGDVDDKPDNDGRH